MEQMVKLSLIICFGILEARSRVLRTGERQNVEYVPEEIVLNDRLTPVEGLFTEKLNPEIINEYVNPETLNVRMVSTKRMMHRVTKRSPGCLRFCLKQKILHPAQCHSYCRFAG